MRLFTAFFIFMLSFPSLAADWTWEGFEIIGQKSVSKAEIQSQIPTHVGSTFEANKPLWNKWCSSIKAKYNFIYADCSAVRYRDYKAYFTVELVDKGEEYRLAFR